MSTSLRVLVTGGAGYIGSHAAKALAAAGMTPIAYDNLGRGHRAAVKWGPLVEGDLADRDALARAFREQAIEAVLHFAGYTYVGESMREPALYYRNNFVNTLRLLEVMREAGVTRIVFSSTAATYGDPLSPLIAEDHPQRPVNPYGESKLAVERALHWYDAAHHVRWAALRYFNAAGADPECDSGECHDPETHLIPLAIEAARGRRPPLDLYGTDYPTPDGTAIRDYVHVTDLADAHVRALRDLMAGGASFAANLGTGRGQSVREVLDAVGRVAGHPVPFREMPRRAGDPAVLVADAARARDRLGWTPVHSALDNIVRTAWAWHTRAGD